MGRENSGSRVSSYDLGKHGKEHGNYYMCMYMEDWKRKMAASTLRTGHMDRLRGTEPSNAFEPAGLGSGTL